MNTTNINARAAWALRKAQRDGALCATKGSEMALREYQLNAEERAAVLRAGQTEDSQQAARAEADRRTRAYMVAAGEKDYATAYHAVLAADENLKIKVANFGTIFEKGRGR